MNIYQKQKAIELMRLEESKGEGLHRGYVCLPVTISTPALADISVEDFGRLVLAILEMSAEIEVKALIERIGK